MSDLDHASDGAVSGNPASAVFEREWRTYRKMVEHNYLFHREAYACLREIMTREVARPFRFLDIACGDASATVGALTGTAIAFAIHYRIHETRPEESVGTPLNIDRANARAARSVNGTSFTGWFQCQSLCNRVVNE